MLAEALGQQCDLANKLAIGEVNDMIVFEFDGDLTGVDQHQPVERVALVYKHVTDVDVVPLRPRQQAEEFAVAQRTEDHPIQPQLFPFQFDGTSLAYQPGDVR